MERRSKKLPRRLLVLGLAMLASLAFAGVAAAGASALSYEPGQEEAPGQEYGLQSGFVEIHDNLYQIQCYGGAEGSGVLWRGTTGSLMAAFSDCHMVNSGWNYKCTTPGQLAGTIVTKGLTTTLTYLNAAHTEYGLIVQGAGSEGTIATYYCGPGETRTAAGELIAQINTPLGVSTAKFELEMGGEWKSGWFPYLWENGFFLSPSEATIKTKFTLSAAGEAPAKFVP